MMKRKPEFVEGARAGREGREAAKAGKPRVSPYEGIPDLAAWHRNWLFGYDALAAVIVKDPTIWGLPEDWRGGGAGALWAGGGRLVALPPDSGGSRNATGRARP